MVCISIKPVEFSHWHFCWIVDDMNAFNAVSVPAAILSLSNPPSPIFFSSAVGERAPRDPLSGHSGRLIERKK